MKLFLKIKSKKISPELNNEIILDLLKEYNNELYKKEILDKIKKQKKIKKQIYKF